MPLGHHRYGKSDVRVVKLERGPERHELHDLTVRVMLEGDYDAVHTQGQNTGLVATDTMRNVVYALAAERTLDSLPDFGRAHSHVSAPILGSASPATRRTPGSAGPAASASRRCVPTRAAWAVPPASR